MITVDHLTKTYGDRRAVDDLTFTVEPGRVTGFVGPNGSGKSTTMRMMVGLTRPDTGNVFYDGTPYDRLARPTTTIGTALDAPAHPGANAQLFFELAGDTLFYRFTRFDFSSRKLPQAGKVGTLAPLGNEHSAIASAKNAGDHLQLRHDAVRLAPLKFRST